MQGSVRRPPPLLPFLLAALCCLATAEAHAGAWTLRRGELYAQAYANSLIPTSTFYDAGRESRAGSVGDYGLQTFGIYAEYGATPWLTALFEVPITRLTITTPAEAYVQPRFRLGARLRMTAAPVVASVQAVVNIPAGFKSDPEPHRFGDGRFEAYAKLLLSRSFGPIYLNVEVGAGMYAEFPEAQFLYGMEVGYSHRWFYAQLGLFGAESLREVKITEDPLADVVRRSSYLLLSPKVGFHLTGWLDLELRLARTLTGANFPVFTELGGALAFRWQG